MKSFSVTTKNLTDRPYLSHKSADNLSEDLPLLSVSVSLKMARMGRSTDIHNLPPKLLHIPYPEVQNTMG